MEKREFNDYIVWDKTIADLLIKRGFEVIGTFKSKKEKDSLGYKFLKSNEFFNALNEIKNSKSSEKFEGMIEKFKVDSEEKVCELNKRVERY